MKKTILFLLIIYCAMIAGAAHAELPAIWRSQGTQKRTAGAPGSFRPPLPPQPRHVEPEDLLPPTEAGFITATDPLDKVAEALGAPKKASEMIDFQKLAAPSMPTSSKELRRAAMRAASQRATLKQLTRFGTAMAGMDAANAVADGAGRFDGGYNADPAKPITNWAISNGAKAAAIAYLGGPATLGAVGVVGIAVATQIAYDKYGKPIVNWTIDKAADVVWGPDRRQRGNEWLVPPDKVERSRILARARDALPPGAVAENRKRRAEIRDALYQRNNPKVAGPQLPADGNLDDALSNLKGDPSESAPATSDDDPPAPSGEDVMSQLDGEAENEIAGAARRARAQVKKQREAVKSSRRAADRQAQAAAERVRAAAQQQQADLEAFRQAMSRTSESVDALGQVTAPQRQSPKVRGPKRQGTKKKQKKGTPHTHPDGSRD